jgi:hypothetical protein
MQCLQARQRDFQLSVEDPDTVCHDYAVGTTLRSRVCTALKAAQQILHLIQDFPIITAITEPLSKSPVSDYQDNANTIMLSCKYPSLKQSLNRETCAERLIATVYPSHQQKMREYLAQFRHQWRSLIVTNGNRFTRHESRPRRVKLLS